MSLNVKEEPKCPWRKNHSRLVPFSDKMETVSSCKVVLEHCLLSKADNLYKLCMPCDSGEVHQTTGSQCLPQLSVPLTSDSTAFKMILSEISLAAPFRGDQIFFSATCPGQVASKNPLVLRNFLLVPKYFSNCISLGQAVNTTFLIQNAIQIKQ